MEEESDKNPVNVWNNNSSKKPAIWITVIKFNLGSNLIWILLKDHLTFLLYHQCICNYRVSAFRFADCLSPLQAQFPRQGLLEVFVRCSGNFTILFYRTTSFRSSCFLQCSRFDANINDGIHTAWSSLKVICFPLLLNFLMYKTKQEWIYYIVQL